MSKTKRSTKITRKPQERTMPTRPRLSLSVSHEAFTTITQPLEGTR